jgi:hypothetical protein
MIYLVLPVLYADYTFKGSLGSQWKAILFCLNLLDLGLADSLVEAKVLAVLSHGSNQFNPYHKKPDHCQATDVNLKR